MGTVFVVNAVFGINGSGGPVAAVAMAKALVTTRGHAARIRLVNLDRSVPDS